MTRKPEKISNNSSGCCNGSTRCHCSQPCKPKRIPLPSWAPSYLPPLHWRAPTSFPSAELHANISRNLGNPHHRGGVPWFPNCRGRSFCKRWEGYQEHTVLHHSHQSERSAGRRHERHLLDLPRDQVHGLTASVRTLDSSLGTRWVFQCTCECWNGSCEFYLGKG